MTGLSEEQRLMRQSCRDFVDDVVIPFIRANWQREWVMTPENRLPNDILEGAEKVGIRTLGVPEEFGGVELDPRSEVRTFALISEEIARGDSGLADKLVQNWKVSVLLRQFAPKHLQEKWFKRLLEDPQFLLAHCLTEPRGASDRWLPYNVPEAAMQTRAVKADGGWVINGRKHFITHGAEADYVILFAVTDPGKGARGGISCFLVDTDTPGFEVGRRQRTMYDEHQAELVFTDCRVGEDALLGKEGYGFYSAMRWINGGRVSIAAMAVGVAQHLYERMLEYAKVREAFGRRIGANQYVQAMIVDTLAELTQARLLVYDLAARLDAGADGRQEAAMAKYVSTEMVGRVADRAIQVFGGNGYMTEMGVERWARFVRAMRLYEGTSEILKTNIARTLGLEEASR